MLLHGSKISELKNINECLTLVEKLLKWVELMEHEMNSKLKNNLTNAIFTTNSYL